MVPSSETCSFCVSVQAVIYFCMIICLNGCQTANVCAGNDSWSDSWLWCEMSSVYETERFSLLFHRLSKSVYIFLLQQPSSESSNKKKKKKPSIHQGNFSCGAPDTCSIYTNYFLFLMDWTWAFIHFSKCPCRQHALCILHLPCEWSPASVLVNSPHWLASGVWTLRMIKSIEGQPDGQHQLTSCSNQPPHWGPVSSFQRGRGSLWYCVDYDWQTQCFGLSPSEMPSSRVHCNSQGQGWGLYVSPDN